MNERITKGDLAQRGMSVIDRAQAEGTIISRQAGGVSFASALEVMEFAKLMSTADKAIGPHLRNNPGACLRIVFQAVEWQMSPWAVADKSYVVNDRLAYESQLIHAIIAARAPITERLEARYEGEGPERRVTVIGHFVGNYEREYTSPLLKDIKVKNSPLWTADPDQQLWYYSSRAWARKWCPDVIAGLYTPDELRDNPRVGAEEAPSSGLHARLVGGNVQREEGYDSEAGVIAKRARRRRRADPTDSQIAEAGADPIERQALSNSTITQEGLSNSAERQDAAEAIAQAEPKTPAEYDLYCRLWLSLETSPDEIDNRWARERQLRNRCGLTLDERDPLVKAKEERVKELTP